MPTHPLPSPRHVQVATLAGDAGEQPPSTELPVDGYTVIADPLWRPARRHDRSAVSA